MFGGESGAEVSIFRLDSVLKRQIEVMLWRLIGENSMAAASPPVLLLLYRENLPPPLARSIKICHNRFKNIFTHFISLRVLKINFLLILYYTYFNYIFILKSSLIILKKK